MKKKEIKLDMRVMDTGWETFGVGVVEKIDVSGVIIRYPGERLRYDNAHVKFLRSATNRVTGKARHGGRAAMTDQPGKYRTPPRTGLRRNVVCNAPHKGK